MPTPAAKKSTNKINDKSFARLNTVAVVAANFLGATLIFSAFAGFFKKWHYYVPVVGNFYNNTSLVETNLITAVIALALLRVKICSTYRAFHSFENRIVDPSCIPHIYRVYAYDVEITIGNSPW